MKPPLHRKVILVQKKLFFIRKSYALKSSKKYFLPDDSGLYKNFFIGENDECRRETAPPQAALLLTAHPGYAICHQATGMILQSRPLPKNGKGGEMG